MPPARFSCDWRHSLGRHLTVCSERLREWLIMPTVQIRDDERMLSEQIRYFEMDDAFCDRMRKAVAAGLESAPIGVVTSPGTKNPKYVPDGG
jgi:hypothetical protein